MKNLGGSYSGCSNVPGLGMCQRLCCWSVVKLCLTLWDFVDCTTPDFTVLHCLPELAQTHFHWVDNTIQQFYPLFSPSPPAFNLSQHQDLFQSQFFESGGLSIGASASASVLSMNVQDWFPLGWTGLISKSKDSQESSPTPMLKSINSFVFNLFYGPTLTSIHDHRKNHSFNYTDLCWQSNVSAF